jgi:hypothetical protein
VKNEGGWVSSVCFILLSMMMIKTSIKKSALLSNEKEEATESPPRHWHSLTIHFSSN